MWTPFLYHCYHRLQRLDVFSCAVAPVDQSHAHLLRVTHKLTPVILPISFLVRIILEDVL